MHLAFKCVLTALHHWFLRVGTQIVPWKSFGNVFKVHILNPFPDIMNQNPWEWGPAVFIKKAFQGFYVGRSLRTDSLYHTREWFQMLLEG